MRGSEDTQNEFYSEFEKDADTAGTPFANFLKKQFEISLKEGDAFTVLELPTLATSPTNLKDYEEAGGGRIVVRSFPLQSVKKIERDENGEIQWIQFSEKRLIRNSPFDAPEILETSWFYDAQNVTTCAIVYPVDRTPADTVEVPSVTTPHGFGKIPVVELCSEGGAHLLEQLFGPQLANFKARAKLSWISNVQANSVPVITGGGDDVSKAFGRGAYIHLPDGSTFTWTNPPSEHLKDLAVEVDSTMMELFRVACLRFMGDETANSMPWRSAASLALVQDSGHINLKDRGKLVREHAEKVYDLISLGRGESITWHAEGFEHLEDLQFVDLVAQGKELGLTNIPSETFKKEFYKLLAGQGLPDIDKTIKQKISSEIEAWDPEKEKADLLAEQSKTVQAFPSNKPAPAIA